MSDLDVSFTERDWLFAFVGGIIIGIATSLNFALMGRITGFSGIFNTLIKFDIKGGLRWKFCFITGLIYTGFLLYYLGDDGIVKFKGISLLGIDRIGIQMFDSRDAKIEGLSLYGWIVSGLLVGIGTKAGNGCTSGHGVCGIPRFSPRSIVAVMTFMATCAFTATYRKNSPFWDEEYTFTSEFDDSYRWALVLVANGLLISFFVIYLITLVIDKETMLPLIETPVSIIIGGIFAFGLCLSGMTRRTKVYNFFTISSDWDPSLGFVMGGAILVNVITFTYVIKHRGRPFFVRKLGPLANGFPDLKLFFGAAVFGIGWGIEILNHSPVLIYKLVASIY